VRSEGSGIEPATFGFVAQYLNHCATAVPIAWMIDEVNATTKHWLPIPMAARSTAFVCGRSLAGSAGSNRAGGMDVSPL
jgi:hypothetical protein